MSELYDKRALNIPVPATAPDVIDSYTAWNDARQPMRPEVVSAIWERRDAGPWSLHELSVNGTAIKKDGRPGVAPRSAQFYRWGRQVQDLPAWVSVAINSYQPEGGSGD